MTDLIFEHPFEVETQYVEITELLKVPIRIVEAKINHNRKGESVVFRMDDGRHCVTYAVSIVESFKKPLVMKTLAEGHPIDAMIDRVPSGDNADRMMYKFV